MRIKLRIPTLDGMMWTALAVATGVGIILLVWVFRPTKVSVVNGQNKEQLKSTTSTLTGLLCEDSTRRPIAVMLASDPEARPLSGLGAADVVVEMPVTSNGITRMMAVFQCGSDPKEIGSVRSARKDFIPLAKGFGAVFAHWGGEHEALDQLNHGIIDNVDAMVYEGTVFYRKPKIPRPHNGFTTLDLLRDKADHLGYAASTNMSAWPHQDAKPARNVATSADTIKISWPQGMNVEFTYDPATNTYLRRRGGQPEIDATTGQQVRVSSVVVMQTDSTYVNYLYMDVRTTGQGSATIYQNGLRTSAIWKKPTATDMLTFVDNHDKQIPLAPGPVWILIDAPLF